MAGRLHLAFWSGVLLCLAHGFLPPLALIAPVPLLVALRGATVRQAFYAGLVTGGVNSFIIAGILHAGLALYVLILASYALFTAGFAIVFVLLAKDRRGWLWSLTAASAWVLMEAGHAWVPYSCPHILGDTQHLGPLLALARLGGSYLVSFVLVWVAAALVEGAAEWKKGRARRWRGLTSLAAALVVTAALLGAARPQDRVVDGSLDVAVVQGGLPTWVYARADQDPAWRDIPLDTYLGLTRRLGSAELVVWPETAVWRIWGEDQSYEGLLADLPRQHGGAFLVGLPRRQAEGSYTNAAVFLSADAAPTFVEKRRLALLAEKGFGPGHRVPLLRAGGARLGVIFCLETVAPQYAREVALAGANLIVVLAEGSRFGETPVSGVHARRSIVRAVETGRVIVHAGQHGHSTVITPAGDYRVPLPPYQSDVLQSTAALYTDDTPYVVWGPWILWPAAIGVAIAGTTRLRRLLGRSVSE